MGSRVRRGPEYTRQVMQFEHIRVHQGETFCTGYRSPDASDVADDAALDLLLVTGDLDCHMTPMFTGGGDTEFIIYMDTTVSSAGTGLSIVNLYHASANESLATATHTPTVSDVGTVKHFPFYMPGGLTGRAVGSGWRPGTEMVFKENTTYLIRLINRAGSAKPLCIGLQWYETEDDV